MWGPRPAGDPENRSQTFSTPIFHTNFLWGPFLPCSWPPYYKKRRKKTWKRPCSSDLLKIFILFDCSFCDVKRFGCVNGVQDCTCRKRKQGKKEADFRAVHSWAVLGPVVLHLQSAALSAQFTTGCARGHITTPAAPRAHAHRAFWSAFKSFPCPEPDAVSCSFWETFAKLAEYELCIASVPALICPPSLCLSPPSRALSEPLCRSMVDKGPLLTSAIIFYLSIGAAIFQVLEEPNWNQAVKQYNAQKDKILEKYPCLSGGDLDRILEVWTSSFKRFILCFTAAWR